MEQTRTVHDSEAFADNVLRVVRSVVLSQYPKLLEVWKELWDFDEQEKRKEILETHLTETVSFEIDTFKHFLENFCEETLYQKCKFTIW